MIPTHTASRSNAGKACYYAGEVIINTEEETLRTGAPTYHFPAMIYFNRVHGFRYHWLGQLVRDWVKCFGGI